MKITIKCPKLFPVLKVGDNSGWFYPSKKITRFISSACDIVCTLWQIFNVISPDSVKMTHSTHSLACIVRDCFITARIGSSAHEIDRVASLFGCGRGRHCQTISRASMTDGNQRDLYLGQKRLIFVQYHW